MIIFPQGVNLIFPSWIKKLALSMNTTELRFDPKTTLWSLSNLTWLRLEFLDFNSLEWGKVIQDMDKLDKLEVLVLKQRYAPMHDDFLLQMTRRLDGLMKQCLNLKLIVFGSPMTQEVMLFRRGGYPWQEVNSILNEFSSVEQIYVGNIYRY